MSLQPHITCPGCLAVIAVITKANSEHCRATAVNKLAEETVKVFL